MSEGPGEDDPFQALRNAYGQAAESWAKAMERAVASEDFAKASGRILTRYIELQEALRSASTTAAEELRLPTVDDIARLATLIANVERKVDEVSDEVHAMNGRLDRLEGMLTASRDDVPGGA